MKDTATAVILFIIGYLILVFILTGSHPFETTDYSDRYYDRDEPRHQVGTPYQY